jgi:D-aspartate ligase
MTTRDKPVPAIVFAHGLNGLGAVRSLGVAGIPVWAVVASEREACYRSRFGQTWLRRQGETVGTAVDRLRTEQGLDGGVVLATSDADALQLSAADGSLPAGFLATGPSRETIAALIDKRSELELLAGHDTALPRSLTRLPGDPAEVLAGLSLPIIVKPRTQQICAEVGFKNRILRTNPELASFLTEFAHHLDLFVAQEVIPGGDDCTWVCNATFDAAGEMVAGFTFQRLGMSPPHFGVTTMAVSRRNGPLLDESRRIAGALGYSGPCMLEFKLDPRDGRLRYIEINPRLGMCNWFDTCCGVNNALTAYQLALGEAPPPRMAQSEGAYFLDFYSDFFGHLTDEAETLASVVARYRPLAGNPRTSAYWLRADPKPALAAFRRRSRRLTGALGRGLAPKAGSQAAARTPGAFVRDLAVRATRFRPVRGAVGSTLGERVSIFVLHRLKDVERPGSGHDPGFLDEAVDQLHALGCQFVSLGDVAELATSGGRPPRKAVALSIDDGYADQVEMGDRLLRRGVPVTLFAITDLVDGMDWPWDAKLSYCIHSSRVALLDFSFAGHHVVRSLVGPENRVSAARFLRDWGKTLPGAQVRAFVETVAEATEVEVSSHPPSNYRPATWEELRAATGRGLEVAVHTRSHRIMSSLTDEEARHEIEWARERIRQEVPGSPEILAWPTGRRQDYGQRDLELAKSLGFRAAFAVNDNYARLDRGGLARFELDRIPMPGYMARLVLFASGLERLRQVISLRGS